MPPYREGSYYGAGFSIELWEVDKPEIGVDSLAHETALAPEPAHAADRKARLYKRRTADACVPEPEEAWALYGDACADYSESFQEGDDMEDLEFSPDDFNLKECHLGSAPRDEGRRSIIRHQKEPEAAEEDGLFAVSPDGPCVSKSSEEDCGFSDRCDKVSGSQECPGSVSDQTPVAPPRVSRTLRRFSALAALLLVAGAVGALWYVSGYEDRYRVETNILYLDAGPDRRVAKGWSWGEEEMLLRSPQLLCMVAQDFFRSHRSLVGEKRTAPTADTSSNSGIPFALASASADSTDAGPFVKWLSQELFVTAQSDSGLATIGLKGEKPEFLMAVLTSYLNQYKRYRSQLIRQKSAEDLRARARKDETEWTAAREKLQVKLTDLNAQIAECRRVLDSMKSRRGSFSGFQPSNTVLGIPSLDEFQKRIVELEMKKRGLAVRFNPRSREVGEVQTEIAGVRNAMRERISEHLQFLTNAQANLLAQKKELDQARPAISGRSVGSISDSAGDLPNVGKSLPFQDGLYLLEKPHVAHEPITTCAGDRWNRMFSTVASGAKAAMGWTREELAAFPFSNSIDIPSYRVQATSDDADQSTGRAPQMTEVIKDKLAAVAKVFRSSGDNAR